MATPAFDPKPISTRERRQVDFKAGNFKFGRRVRENGLRPRLALLVTEISGLRWGRSQKWSCWFFTGRTTAEQKNSRPTVV